MALLEVVRATARLRSDLLGLMLVCSGCLLSSGCSRPEGDSVWVRDLHLEIAAESPELVSDVVCSHQRVEGLVLRPGGTIAVEAPSNPGARLVLEGCSQPARGWQRRSEDLGRLVVTVLDDESRTLQREVIAPESRYWWREALPLRAESGDRIELAYEGSDWDLILRTAVVEPKLTRVASSARRVLLVSIDTLREDGIGALGGERGEPSTPNIDELVEGAQVFSPHYAAASWTKPSHASLLSGVLPQAHGALSFEDGIDDGVLLLPERLREAGFATHGVVSDVLWLRPRWGFDRGFDSYEVTTRGGGDAVRRVANLIAESRDRDLFVFLHLFEPHSDTDVMPYEGPGATPWEVERRFGVADFGCRAGLCATDLLLALDNQTVEPLPADQEILRYLYQSGVETADQRLGELFDLLRAAGIYDQTLIILTSDHGEALMEHGRVGHGNNWEEVLRIPLVIKWPQGERAGEHVTVPTSAIDLVPTILEHLGMSTEGLPGRSLGSDDVRRPVPIFSGTLEPVLWLDRMKLHSSGQDVALFDLELDSGELDELSQAEPDTVATMFGLLSKRIEQDRASRTADASNRSRLTEEEQAQLRALGYVD